MSYTITAYSKAKAKKLKVIIKKSTNKKKKIDVFKVLKNKSGEKNIKKIATIGDIKYKDYPTFMKEDKKLAVRKTENYKNNSDLYGKIDRPDFMRKNGESAYEPPLPNSLLEIKSQKGKHATQKPTALIEWCLKYYSKEGDTILDPTMGSGSTGVACKNMNRNFIGIEKDEKIFNSAVERLK